jgi:hypothetical protein
MRIAISNVEVYWLSTPRFVFAKLWAKIFRKVLGKYLKLGHDRFLSPHFQFIIH